MKANIGLWKLVLWGMMQLTHSQESTTDETTWSSEANVESRPVLHNQTQLVTLSDSFHLSPSFMESTPTPSMNETVITIPLETPSNQEDLPTLSLIDATSTNHVDESIWATPDTQIKMLRDTYTPGILDEDTTIFANQSINHFVLMSSDSAEDDSDDGEVYIVSPTPVPTFVHSKNTPVAPTPTQTADLVSSIYNQSKDSDEAITTESKIQSQMGFLMKFQSGCIQDDVEENSVRNFLDEFLRNSTTLADQNVTIITTGNICERVITEIPVRFEEKGQNVEEILKSLKSLVGKTNLTVQSSGSKSYVLTLVSVVPFPSNASGDGDREKNKQINEFLPYVIIGGVFGGILLIVLLLMCGKCLCRCRKQKKPKRPDFEVPHLSLRPEDYMLTRIPRPTTIYADNMASPIMHDEVSISSGQACYNGDQTPRQSFETSVVPMDEIRDNDPYYRYKQHEYLPHNESSTELRTFNGKRLHHRSTETDDSVLYRNPYSSASTEKIHELNHRRSRDAMGIDNQAYMRA